MRYSVIGIDRFRTAKRGIARRCLAAVAAWLLVSGQLPLQAQLQPNDPFYANQWYAPLTQLPQAWGTSIGSPSVTIALIDTGVITSTPDLAGRVLPAIGGVHVLGGGVNPPYTDSELAANSALHHGTWVASVAAMGVNNSISGAGVGNFSILPIDVANSAGQATPNDIALAVRTAADAGAKIINISFAAATYSAIDTQAAYAVSKGALVFVAAGNTNTRIDMTGLDNLIFVSGTDEQDQRWGTGLGMNQGSSYGPYVDLSAPAHNILIADPADSNLPNGVGLFSGTSFAAPFASGAAALAWSINPNLTSDQVRNILFSTAADLGAPGWDEEFGWGRIDFGAVAAAAVATVPEPQTVLLMVMGAAGLLAIRRFPKAS